MPFYRVHMNNGESEILYAYSEDHAQAIAKQKLGPDEPGIEVQKVEYLKLEDE